MSEAIRRINQLEIALERIEDEVIRESFVNVIELMRSMQGEGLGTDGTLSARRMEDGLGKFSVENGILKAIGIRLGPETISESGIQTDDLGEWRTRVFQGVQGSVSGSNYTLDENCEILGIVGWAQTNVSAGGGLYRWNCMDKDPDASGTSGGSQMPYFSHGAGSEASFRVYNPTAISCAWRALVFYRKTLT